MVIFSIFNRIPQFAKSTCKCLPPHVLPVIDTETITALISLAT